MTRPNAHRNGLDSANTVTIDKGKLQSLLAIVTSKVSVMGQLGTDMNHVCESMNESLTMT